MRRERFIITAFVAILVAALLSPAGAQTSRSILFTGARIHTGDGTVHPRGDILIRSDKIVAVGTNLSAPRGTQVVPVRGRIITPGLIDAATSLGLVEIWAVGRSRDNSGGKKPIRASFRAMDGFNPASMVFGTARNGGITSAVSLPLGGIVSGQSLWVDLHGDYATVVNDRIALHANLGPWGGRRSGGSRGSALGILRNLLNDAKSYRDNKKSYDGNRMRELSAKRAELETAARFLDGRRIVVVHADRASDIRNALRLKKQHGFRMVLIGGREAWRTARELGEHRVPVILDPNDNIPAGFDSLGARADNAALLDKAGVEVVLSTFDAFSSRHRAQTLRFRAGNAVRSGLPWNKALRAITLAPARAMGMDRLYGSLAPGKLANLVIWTGDPFEPSSHAERVYIRGKRVSLESRQKALLRRYLKLPPRDIE